MAGKLYIVSTPIGNLGDMTKRAMEVLAAADYIAAEDTRRTLALLNSLGIGGRLLSCHEHSRRAAYRACCPKRDRDCKRAWTLRCHRGAYRFCHSREKIRL